MSEVTPPWAYETPEIRPHDPRLLLAAETERGRLAELLAPWLADGVEHVGSTAVPGLAAKPVIDLMASVRDLSADRLLLSPGWVDGRAAHAYRQCTSGAKRACLRATGGGSSSSRTSPGSTGSRTCT